MNNNPLYLTSDKLSIRWSLLPETLGKWRYLRKGPPYYKIGNRVLYKISDIEEFEKKNAQITATVRLGHLS